MCLCEDHATQQREVVRRLMRAPFLFWRQPRLREVREMVYVHGVVMGENAIPFATILMSVGEKLIRWHHPFLWSRQSFAWCYISTQKFVWIYLLEEDFVPVPLWGDTELSWARSKGCQLAAYLSSSRSFRLPTTKAPRHLWRRGQCTYQRCSPRSHQMKAKRSALAFALICSTGYTRSHKATA